MTLVVDVRQHRHASRITANRQKCRCIKALCTATDELHFFVQYTVASAARTRRRAARPYGLQAHEPDRAGVRLVAPKYRVVHVCEVAPASLCLFRPSPPGESPMKTSLKKFLVLLVLAAFAAPTLSF